MDGTILRSFVQQEAKASLPAHLTVVPKDILKDPRTIVSFVDRPGASNSTRKAVKPYVSPPNEVWPGVLSTDPRFVEFKKTLAIEATTRFPANIDSDGFADKTGVTRDFSALLSCSGIKMDPSNAPVVDREKMLADAKVSNGFVNDRHARIARALHRQMFGKRDLGASYHFSAVSSTSNPFFAYDTPWKKDMILRLLSQAEEILQKVDKDDLHGLYRDHGMMFMATLVERHQPEGGTGLLENKFSPKARKVASIEYALSGGRSGSLITADKSSMLKQHWGINPQDACAMRVRTAYGFAGAVSYFVSCWFAGMRSQYYNSGAFTWHHTTPEQIYSKIEGAEAVIGLDVTTMDQLYPSFLLDKHAEWIGEYVDPRFAKLLSWVNYAPYFAPQLGSGLKPYWAGDPRKLSTFNVDVGLSSGRADNPDLGKFYMTFVYLAFMDDVLGDLLSFAGDEQTSLAAALAGKHPRFKLLDMSDDAVLIFPKGESELVAQVKKRIAEGGSSPYAVLQPETGVAFLGNVLIKDGVGQLTRPIPNPVTYLVNRHCPEHGIRSNHRKFWGLGLYSATEHYSQAGSVISELIDMTRFYWKKSFDEVPNPYQMAARHMELQSLRDLPALSYIDADVLLNPSKRHYRYRPEDISPEVLELLTGTVDGDTIEAHLGKYWS